MIIARAPLRVTLGGGGTDLKSFYSEYGGFIFAMALDKHIQVTAHRPAFDPRVVVHGPEPEIVLRADDLRHELLKAALRRFGVQDHFELASLADIPGGTGLGSSSCFLVALLRALHALHGSAPDPQALAEEACELEIETLGRGIGKQDQYMAAFGGLTTLEIEPDGRVTVERVTLEPELEAAFLARTHIYYTGLRRDAAVVLGEQNQAMQARDPQRRAEVADSLLAIKDLGRRILSAWREGDLDGWGRMLHEHWLSKKRLSSRISWSRIDELYEHVRGRYGVLGGKIIGAGGGGFLMLYVPDGGPDLEEFMASERFPRLRYGIGREGARLLGGAA